VTTAPPAVAVVRTEDLTEAQRAEIVEVCVAAHDDEDFRRIFTYYIPSGGRHFMVSSGDELVSHAVVTTRWLQPEGHRELRTAFVDAVSTRPTDEGRGFASAAMSRLAAEIDDYEVACLETDIPEFYARLGWELWRGPLSGRSDDGLIPTPAQQGVMVLRLPRTPALDLDRGLSIECQRDRIWG
jgi:aminoglycoside 2'-N-acetyltransferase I